MGSPVMQATGWRIVLTWGMAPLDVDLHVYWGTTSNPLKYQVYYRNKNTPLMSLDVDDRFSEGPETVTIPDCQRPGSEPCEWRDGVSVSLLVASGSAGGRNCPGMPSHFCVCELMWHVMRCATERLGRTQECCSFLSLVA